MADFNLEAMSLKELRQLQKDLAKAISTYEDRHKAEARAKLEAIAKEMGYSLAELIGIEVKATRAPAVAKYRHPENAAHLVGPWPETAVVRGSHQCGQRPERARGLRSRPENAGSVLV
jgi:DNA-binding protein H-NS